MPSSSLYRGEPASPDTSSYPDLLRAEQVWKGSFIGRWLPPLILLAGMLVTYQLHQQARSATRLTLQTTFDFQASTSKRSIEQRLRTYLQIMHGAAGLFAAEDKVTRLQFHRYVAELRLEQTNPGVQGLGFAAALKPEELSDHVAAVRAEGFPDYAVLPAYPRPFYSAIVYLEPFSGRNLRAFGYDMFSEAVRREAMEQARDSGEVAISGKVTLVQETDSDVQYGFLMYQPVYRHDVPHATTAQRRASLLGWVYAPFRIGDLISRANSGAKDLDIEIYDGATPSRQSRMLDLEPGLNATNGELSRIDHLTLGNHEWTIASRMLPNANRWEAMDRSQTVLVAGTGMTLLLAVLAWLFIDDRRHALQAARQALQLALYDTLTNLPNRKYMADLLRRSLLQAQRDQVHLTLLFIDLDEFKPVNDNYGHAIGDLLLKDAGARLQGCLRRSDTVARIGGDEFVALLSGNASRDNVGVIVQKILNEMMRPFEVAGHHLQISASIGIAFFPEDGSDEVALLKHADAAMYLAKQNGRNKAEFFAKPAPA